MSQLRLLDVSSCECSRLCECTALAASAALAGVGSQRRAKSAGKIVCARAGKCARTQARGLDQHARAAATPSALKAPSGQRRYSSEREREPGVDASAFFRSLPSPSHPP
eukprot:6179151-Pleurochrysis_carterae.AAC.3